MNAAIIARTNLLRANDVRLARTQIKNDVRSLPRLDGCEVVAALLTEPPACIHQMGVAELLTSIHGVGSTRITDWLNIVGVSPLARVAGDYAQRHSGQNPGVMSERHRLALVALLRGQL